jgi:hypothetical protein
VQEPAARERSVSLLGSCRARRAPSSPVGANPRVASAPMRRAFVDESVVRRGEENGARGGEPSGRRLGGEAFPDPVGDRGHLEPRPRDVCEQILCARLLAE